MQGQGEAALGFGYALRRGVILNESNVRRCMTLVGTVGREVRPVRSFQTVMPEVGSRSRSGGGSDGDVLGDGDPPRARMMRRNLRPRGRRLARRLAGNVGGTTGTWHRPAAQVLPAIGRQRNAQIRFACSIDVAGVSLGTPGARWVWRGCYLLRRKLGANGAALKLDDGLAGAGAAALTF